MECARKTEAVQQAKGERDEPGLVHGQSRTLRGRAEELCGQVEDAESDDRLDWRLRQA